MVLWPSIDWISRNKSSWQRAHRLPYLIFKVIRRHKHVLSNFARSLVENTAPRCSTCCFFRVYMICVFLFLNSPGWIHWKIQRVFFFLICSFIPVAEDPKSYSALQSCLVLFWCANVSARIFFYLVGGRALELLGVVSFYIYLALYTEWDTVRWQVADSNKKKARPVRSPIREQCLAGTRLSASNIRGRWRRRRGVLL